MKSIKYLFIFLFIANNLYADETDTFNKFNKSLIMFKGKLISIFFNEFISQESNDICYQFLVNKKYVPFSHSIDDKERDIVTFHKTCSISPEIINEFNYEDTINHLLPNNIKFGGEYIIAGELLKSWNYSFVEIIPYTKENEKLFVMQHKKIIKTIIKFRKEGMKFMQEALKKWQESHKDSNSTEEIYNKTIKKHNGN